MPLPDLTPQEIVQTLKHSSLPTLIVEGKDDVIIYRWIQQKVNKIKETMDFDIEILPCSGRPSLLKVYEERSEFNHITTIFLADKDAWSFSGIPLEYKDIVFTSGYCIENDLYAGAIEQIEELIENPTAIEHFNNQLEKITHWYSFEIENHLSGNDYCIDYPIERIFENAALQSLCSNFLTQRNFSSGDSNIIEEVKSNNYLKLKGKLIFQLLEKSALKQKKYKTHQLFEIILRYNNENIYINSLIEQISNRLPLET